jgi:hypothetical protein
MKLYICLCLLGASFLLNGCAQKQSPDISVNTALQPILSCAVDKVFICTIKKCRSIPVIANETNPYPIAIDVKQNKIFNKLSSQDIKESAILKAAIQGDDLLLWGQSTSIETYQESSDWVIRIHPSKNTFEYAGLTQSKSIIIYGHCEVP